MIIRLICAGCARGRFCHGLGREAHLVKLKEALVVVQPRSNIGGYLPMLEAVMGMFRE
jgi:hypothetical protein